LLWFLGIGVVIAIILLALTMPPPEAAKTLQVGDRAPDFQLTDQNGREVRLADYRGKNTVVLAFYIKANTPG
jgi:cytochrome oxidase Cu insertion factor (SCO1/SenC/PrrC family)